MRDSQPIIVKKKKIIAAAHHGGSWKVAYADFVTAMMAFFLVMWIMGLSADHRASIAHYFNDPFSPIKSANEGGAAFGLGFPADKMDRGGTGSGANSLAHLESDARHLIDGLTATLKTLEGNPDLVALVDSIEFRATDEGVRMEFLEKNGAAFFDIGSAAIRTPALVLIDRIAPFLRDANRDIVIEGHTDARPLNNPNYDNMDLSTDRAASMKRALIRYGVEPSKIREIRGYADHKLYDPSDPYHWSNRRVSVLLPYGVTSEVIGAPPEELMQRQMDGLFREDFLIAPPPVDVRGDQNSR